MNHYNKKEAAKKLKITEATITKYALLFVKHDYKFITDGENGSRLFTEEDLERFEQVIALKGVMKVEEAIKQVIKGNSVSLYNPITPSIMNDKLDTILDHLRITNERIEGLEKENNEIKKMLTDRDQVLMETMRTMQETKKLITAAQQPSRKWWEFWK